MSRSETKDAGETEAWPFFSRVKSIQYAAAAGGATYNYRFDDMGRLSSMTQGGNSVATATYGWPGN